MTIAAIEVLIELPEAFGSLGCLEDQSNPDHAIRSSGHTHAVFSALTNVIDQAFGVNFRTSRHPVAVPDPSTPARHRPRWPLVLQHHGQYFLLNLGRRLRRKHVADHALPRLETFRLSERCQLEVRRKYPKVERIIHCDERSDVLRIQADLDVVD